MENTGENWYFYVANECSRSHGNGFWRGRRWLGAGGRPVVEHAQQVHAHSFHVPATFIIKHHYQLSVLRNPQQVGAEAVDMAAVAQQCQGVFRNHGLRRHPGVGVVTFIGLK
jgi:hypothetical protein